MDFSLSEEQQAIADLAKQIFTDKATNERLRTVELADGPRFDPSLYAEVAKAGLLGIPIPEEYGGAGMGFLEVAAILEQVGRTTAPIPLLETVVLGAMPIAEFGSEAQRAEWLPRVASGEAILTGALVSDTPVDAVEDGNGFRLNGRVLFVPAGQIAERVLVPARVGKSSAVFLIDPNDASVTVEPLVTTSGQPEASLTFVATQVGAADRLSADGDAIVAWMRLRATAALAAVTLGVCESALDLTAEYTKTRKQFDQPIAMFQAVAHRVADAYIDTEAIRLTTWQAAWRIGAGLDAVREVAVAKFWAAEAGKRVVHAAQHLHGGVGVDREYPLHRYFLYARQLELSLGGATSQLLDLGRMLAAEA